MIVITAILKTIVSASTLLYRDNHFSRIIGRKQYSWKIQKRQQTEPPQEDQTSTSCLVDTQKNEDRSWQRWWRFSRKLLEEHQSGGYD